MATYDSIHTGEQVDEAVDIVLGNKSKGSATQPIYLDANGAAQTVTVDATPIDSSAALVQSGGVYTQLSTKYAKADISTDVNLGTSNTIIPSQGAVKSYVDTHLAGKQDVVVAGDGIVKEGNTLSISTDNDFMTVGKLDNKWSHFVSGLDMGYGTETIEKMEKAKHSTYVGDQPSNASPLDPKKFTYPNGHKPTITTDGIATGFSNTGTYIMPTGITLTPTDNFHIRGEFTLNDLTNLQNILGIHGTNADILIEFRFDQDNKRGLLLYENTNSSSIATARNSISANVSYIYDIIVNGSNITFKLNGETIGTKTDFIGDTSTTINIGRGRAATYPVNGSIDLKQFSITINGVEVFSGNKTGIDTIKPVDFTVITSSLSSPFVNPALPFSDSGVTISEDGIASGFTNNNNYVTLNNTSSLDFSKPFEIDISFTFGDGITQTIVLNDSSGVNGWRSSGSNNKQRMELFLAGTYKGPLTDRVFVIDTLYDMKFTFDGIDKYKCFYKEHTASSYTEGLTLTTSSTLSLADDFCLMKRTIANGIVDLNSIHIYVDGDLVYQPCLKIPYTQTKDGKKIVGYNYKSRVEDEYGQAGFTPYYTLDTESRGNYQVVGSPTISSDFIASGFATRNVIQTITLTPNTSPWEIRAAFNISQLSGVDANAILGGSQSADKKVPSLEIFPNGKARIFITYDGSNWNTKDSTYVFSTNTDYWIKYGYTGSEYYLDYSLDDDNYTRIITLTSSTPIYQGGYILGIGNTLFNSSVTTHYFQGTIDLKEFKIYVDNNLAYQAVIPPNYTMATVKESAVVDSYDNGMNKWTKYANLDFIQQGSCTSGTAVTFAKPFRDANYALSVPYTSGTKTATGFTPSFTDNCDYIAKGKCNLTFPQE